jgi:hypothetical protein
MPLAPPNRSLRSRALRRASGSGRRSVELEQVEPCGGTPGDRAPDVQALEIREACRVADDSLAIEVASCAKAAMALPDQRIALSPIVAVPR